MSEPASQGRLGWPLPGEPIVFFPDQAEKWEGLNPSENLYFDIGVEESGGNIFVMAHTLKDGVAIQRINRENAEAWLVQQGYAKREGASKTDFDPDAWISP